MEKNNIEIWSKIEGYEDYEISSFGNVKSNKFWNGKKDTILKINNAPPYSGVNLCKDGKIKRFSVHRLVAMVFIPNPLNLPQVNHRDGNKKNNRVENLEWVTAKENNDHAVLTGLWDCRGENCHTAKVDRGKVELIRDLYKKGGTSCRILGREFGISAFAISQIINNKTWR